MACPSSLNATWDITPDYHISYTGQSTMVAGYKILQGYNYQKVVEQLIDAVNYIDNKVYYTPYIKLDNTLLFDMTGAQVESKHPNAPLGAIVYNDVDGFEFSKLAEGIWKFQIIDIRK